MYVSLVQQDGIGNQTVKPQQWTRGKLQIITIKHFLFSIAIILHLQDLECFPFASQFHCCYYHPHPFPPLSFLSSIAITAPSAVANLKHLSSCYSCHCCHCTRTLLPLLLCHCTIVSCHQLLPQVGCCLYYYCSSPHLLHFPVDNVIALSPMRWPSLVANKFLDCCYCWLIADFLDYFFVL